MHTHIYVENMHNYIIIFKKMCVLVFNISTVSSMTYKKIF